MEPEFTFQQLEIQDGDIICFQKALTEKEYVLIIVHTFYLYCKIILTFYNFLGSKNIQQLAVIMISLVSMNR